MQQPTDFAIIPDRESIASVERDIRFFATENSSPVALTPDQVATWNAAGYLGPLAVFDSTSVIAIRTYFESTISLLQGIMPHGSGEPPLRIFPQTQHHR